MSIPEPRGMPGYWMNEVSGVLRPAVRAYLLGGPLSGEQIATLRAYLRQWIGGHVTSPVWFVGPEVAALRASIDGLTTRRAIAAWLERAVDAGIDPL